MRVLITGICGFAGSVIARELRNHIANVEVLGIDNFIRPGSELNRLQLRREGIRVLHADIRSPSDLEALPKADWVIDAAANPSVLAGVTGPSSSRQLMEHNLVGTLNVLEFCKRHSAGLVVLSTSRVYSCALLSELRVQEESQAFLPVLESPMAGISAEGVAETFSTAPPLSLYGAAKLASEVVALEFGAAFGFPVFINRCGVLAGAGQFGKPDQGILSFWIHSYKWKRPLRYIGFGGRGFQVRDFLHPRDLAALLTKQICKPDQHRGVMNVSGGASHSLSLAQVTNWCETRFGAHTITADGAARPFDVPWLVLDSSRARQAWQWRPEISLSSILEEIAEHAEKTPDWLELSSDA